MKTFLLGLTVFLAGLLCGLATPRARYFVRKVYIHRKYGICWNYQPTGYRENRNGTYSDFCKRCGHPAGYHD